MRNNNIAVVDLETSGLDTNKCQILEIACYMLDGKSHKIIDKFYSLIRPEKESEIEEEALKINNLSISKLRQAPSIYNIFPVFAEFLNKYNLNKMSSNGYTAPVLAGYNIRGFDYPILVRYATRFKYLDKNGRPKIFHPQFIIDVMDHLFLYTRHHPDFNSLKLTNFLAYAGIKKQEIDDKAHNAMWDTEMTAKIVQKFCRLADYMIDKNEQGKRRLEFKNCMLN